MAARSSELARLSEDELVRRFAACRDAGDRAGAEAVWERLGERVHPRVRGLVGAFVFPGQGVRIASPDRDDACQDAYLRVAAMALNFRGDAPGQFMAAVRTTVRNACMDFCRRTMTREMGLTAPLEDETVPAVDDTEGREAADALARALALLASDDQRHVVHATLAGAPVPEIAEALGTSVDNVYQLRSRAFRRLREVLDAHGR